MSATGKTSKRSFMIHYLFLFSVKNYFYHFFVSQKYFSLVSIIAKKCSILMNKSTRPHCWTDFLHTRNWGRSPNMSGISNFQSHCTATNPALHNIMNDFLLTSWNDVVKFDMKNVCRRYTSSSSYIDKLQSLLHTIINKLFHVHH